MGSIFLTDCCGAGTRYWGGAGGSVWGHADTCKKCGKENPVMTEVDTSEPRDLEREVERQSKQV